jgi:hypothetical protein
VIVRINYLAVVVAAVAAFVLSSAYYGLLGQAVIKLHADPAAAAATLKPAPWKVIVELARTLIVAYVLAVLAARLGIADWRSAVQLAVMLWIAFSVVMWIGAIMWENVPVALAAIHTGDWLVKTVLVTVIVGLWRR